MLWGCCWGGWGGAAPRSSGTLLLGSTCCPSLREVRHVGQEVSCSSQDVKQELSNREGGKYFYDTKCILQLISFLTLNWLDCITQFTVIFISSRDVFRIAAEVFFKPECFKLWDIGPLNCKKYIVKKNLMKLQQYQ